MGTTIKAEKTFMGIKFCSSNMFRYLCTHTSHGGNKILIHNRGNCALGRGVRHLTPNITEIRVGVPSAQAFDLNVRQAQGRPAGRGPYPEAVRIKHVGILP